MLTKDQEQQYKAVLTELEEMLNLIKNSEVQDRLKKTYARISSLDKFNIEKLGSENVPFFRYHDLNDSISMELSCANVGLERTIYLRMNSYQDLRANEQAELNNHELNEPEGFLKIKAKKEWQKKRDEIMARLYAPGPKSTSQTLEIRVKKNKQTGDVSCSIEEKHREEAYDKEMSIISKSGESTYKFLNGRKVSKNEPEYLMI